MPSLYDYLENQRRVRIATTEAKQEALYTQDGKRDEVVNFFDGIDSHDILRGYYAARYGYRLAKSVDGNSGSETYTYKKGMAADAISYGMYQVAETKTLQRVVRSLACLFTQPDQRFEFIAESGQFDAGLLNLMRKDSGYLKHLIRTDRISVLLGSSAIRVSYQAGRLKYEGGLTPQVITLVWPEMVSDGDQERAVDKSDIEDAECVILKLEDSAGVSSSYNTSKYCAWFGRSEKYQHGRYVIYWASKATAIPDVGQPNIIEYEDPNLGVCNPLTAMQDTTDEGFSICPYEYPIAVLHGQDVGISCVFPETSFSLYDNAIEFDLMQSRLLKAADVASRGSIAVILDQGGIPPESPDEGVCILPRGARREIGAVSSAGVKDGQEALKQAQLQLATGYGVPGYEVISDATGAPESGVALAVRSQAKKDARRERVNASEGFVNKIWHLERGVLRWFGQPDQWIPDSVEQSWYAGEWQPPTSGVERIAEIEAQYNLGVIDYLEAVRQAHSLADRDSAKALVDGWKADAPMYGGPNQRTALRIPPRGATGGLP